MTAKRYLRTLALAVAIVMLFSTVANAAIPTNTIIIGGKAYDLSLLNDPAMVNEILAAFISAGNTFVYKAMSGDLVDPAGSTVQPTTLPQVQYVDAEKDVTVYNSGDGAPKPPDYTITSIAPSASTVGVFTLATGTDCTLTAVSAGIMATGLSWVAGGNARTYTGTIGGAATGTTYDLTVDYTKFGLAGGVHANVKWMIPITAVTPSTTQLGTFTLTTGIDTTLAQISGGITATGITWAAGANARTFTGTKAAAVAGAAYDLTVDTTKFTVASGVVARVTWAAAVATTITVATTALDATIIAGDVSDSTIQLTATVKDQYNRTMTGHIATWQSSDAGKASVSATGLVTAVGEGTAGITARVGTVSSSAYQVTVQSGTGVYLYDTASGIGKVASVRLSGYASATHWKLLNMSGEALTGTIGINSYVVVMFLQVGGQCRLEIYAGTALLDTKTVTAMVPSASVVLSNTASGIGKVATVTIVGIANAAQYQLLKTDYTQITGQVNLGTTSVVMTLNVGDGCKVKVYDAGSNVLTTLTTVAH